METLEKAINENAREFAIKTSAHGFSFRFDGNDPNKPTLSPLSFQEAYGEAIQWEIIADTVGGLAELYHIPTGKTTNLPWLQTYLR